MWLEPWNNGSTLVEKPMAHHKNSLHRTLEHPEKFLAPLYIKLSLMKEIVKALTKDCDCFKYL